MTVQNPFISDGIVENDSLRIMYTIKIFARAKYIEIPISNFHSI